MEALLYSLSPLEEIVQKGLYTLVVLYLYILNGKTDVINSATGIICLKDYSDIISYFYYYYFY